jgi:hypothetical protein
MTSIIKTYDKPFKDWSPGRQQQWKRGILKNILELNRYPISVEALSQGRDIKPESIVNVIFGTLGKSNKDFPIPLEGTLSPRDATGLAQGQEYAIFLWNYYLGVALNSPSEKKEKAKAFISGETSFRSGKKISAKTTSISNIIPKKTIPQEIAEKITSPSELGGGENEPVTNAPRGVITSLGRLTLNLEQSNNNLEKIIEVIKDDYKTTKETNKKEIEDYRKRVANRGRILGKKELGNDKVDLSGIIKKYVGSFFSGTGGAIRALAGLNLIEGIMTGDPGKILGSLTGITASYLPAIGMAIGGKVAENLGKSLFLGGGRRSGGGIVRGFGGIAREAKPISRLARGGGRLALGAGLAAGALAIGGKIFGGGGEAQRVGDITNPKQNGQGGADVLMPKDSLKRFDDLNTKFEQAVNMLLSGGGGPGLGPGPGGGGGPVISSSPGEANLAAFISTLESSQLQDQSDVLQSMANRAGQNYSGHGGLFGQLTASNQYSPLSAVIHGTTDQAAQRKYGPIAAQLGNTPQERIARLQQIISQPDALSQLQTLFGAGNASNAKKLLDDFYSNGPLSKESQKLIGGRTNFGARSGVGGATGSGQIRRSSNTFGAAGANKAPSLLSGLTPSPAPGITPSASAPRYLPSPGGGDQGITAVPVSAGAMSAPSSATSEGSEGPPAINTTYYENFLALYSKLIYQIV